MAYSELKYKIKNTRLRHEKEKEQLSAKHKQEMNSLLKQCNHKYDDGSSAKVYWEGSHRMSFGEECKICGKRL